MLTIAERSGFEYLAHFAAADDRPTIPPTAHWRLYNVTADEVVQDWTALTPVEEYDEAGNIADVYALIVVPASLHVLSDTNAKREEFQLLVVSGKYTDQELGVEPDFIYAVRRQKGRD